MKIIHKLFFSLLFVNKYGILNSLHKSNSANITMLTDSVHILFSILLLSKIFLPRYTLPVSKIVGPCVLWKEFTIKIKQLFLLYFCENKA